MKTTKRTASPDRSTVTRKQATAECRQAHHAALAALYLATMGQTPADPSGLSLWRALARIERDASAATTAQCNGAPYAGQPYREDDYDDATPDRGTEWDAFTASIRARVAKVFGGTLPAGFLFNQDPRGYSLKLDPQKGAVIPPGLVTDWGSYGILAPRID